MSASDSDGSIDWLASDDEDKDSLLELDCEQATVGRTLPLPAPSGGSRCGPFKIGCTSGTKEREGSAAGFPGCNTPSGYAKPPGGEGGCQPGRSGSPSVPLPHSSGSLACEEPRQAAKRHHSSTAPECREHPWVEEAEGEKLFAHKCLELQCYIPPLSSILNGLRSGRYRERLSSFQESVAMDRIQRIMGVLQNRGMGQRHIGIILKVEDMLKNWFPNVQPKDQPTSHQTEKTLSAKKQKLSPVTTALPIQVTSASSLCALSLNTGALRASMVTQPRAFSTTNLKWLHTSPISSPVVDLPVGRLWSREKDVTQDNAVSSSTDAAGDSPPPRPPLGKISAPCLERLLKSTESIVACKGEHRDSKENS